MQWKDEKDKWTVGGGVSDKQVMSNSETLHKHNKYIDREKNIIIDWRRKQRRIMKNINDG